MGNFSLIVTLPNYSQAALNEEMQRFHEFETTGIDDCYIYDIDITDKLYQDYETKTIFQLQGLGGEIADPFDDRFYRPFTDAELAANLCENGNRPKDWSKTRYVPFGWERVELKIKEYQSFRDFVKSATKFPEIISPKNHRYSGDEKTKYGYTLIDAKGNVIKTIHRTNPKAKWDRFEVGGCFAGGFFTTSRKSCDIVRKIDVDWTIPEIIAKIMADRYWGYLTDVFTKKELDSLNPKNPETEEKLATIKHKYFADYWEDLSDIMGGYNYQKLLEREMSRRLSTFAILHKGQWFSKAQNPWGIKIHEVQKWNLKSREFIRNLPDDIWLINIDCHI